MNKTTFTYNLDDQVSTCVEVPNLMNRTKTTIINLFTNVISLQYLTWELMQKTLEKDLKVLATSYFLH